MAEGGMFLNFDTPDAFVPSTNSISTFKGRWTERLKAKRAQTYQQKKSSNHRTPEISTAFTMSKDEATAEELHMSRGFTVTTSADSSLKRKFVLKSLSTKPPRSTDGTFVSSLWTCNPKSFCKSAATQPTETRETQVPSNAPVSDVSLTFTTLGISPILANHLATKLMLNAPTAIQCSAIPELISGSSDTFIQAETGSGKTLTYLLPILDRIMRLDATSRLSGLFAIILVPTRELSKQIYAVLQTLIHCKNGPQWIVPGQVTGGEKKKSEKARLRKGLNILVATPGRLLDHLQNTTVLKVDKVRWLVLDEGDRLMELGFEEDIEKIMDILNAQSKLSESVYANDFMPKKRVTILCSATMKTNVQKLGEISLQEAHYITAEKSKTETMTDRTETFLAPTQLRQSYIVTPAKLRLVGLNAVLQLALVRPTAHSKIIVFFSCTDSVDFHFELFTRNLPQTGAKKPEHKAATVETGKIMRLDDMLVKKHSPPNPSIAPGHLLNLTPMMHKLHGSLAQPIRTTTLASFTNAKNPVILFCTDVAARGLDLPNVDLIVQFDPPFSPDDHLHRIGRTARAGRDGRAVMFLLPGPEEGYVDSVLKKGISEGQLVRCDLHEMIQKGFGLDNIGKKRDYEDKATEWHQQVERWVMGNPEMGQLAAKAWGSHIRAYTTHIGSEKRFFNHKKLHYGHLAKSFGLRDNPTSINVPNSEASSGGKGKKRKMAMANVGVVREDEEINKMRMTTRSIEIRGMCSEFNIG